MASIFMRFPEGRARALTLSYDDGVESDIQLIDIMKANRLKGTFNINAGSFAPEGTTYRPGTVHRRMSESQCKACYTDSGMEVAIHGLTHPFLEQLPAPMCTYEVLEDKRRLENLFGTLIRGAAYPYGSSSQSVVDTLRLCGIAYCRTTVSTGRFDIPTDWLRLPTTCHHRDSRLMSLADSFLEARTDRAPQLFYLWGHSYEFDGDNNWHVIEEFAKRMGNREDIWYATNIELYDYIEAYRQLRFSVSGKIVQNPTATPVWFTRNGKDSVCVGAGQTLTL